MGYALMRRSRPVRGLALAVLPPSLRRRLRGVTEVPWSVDGLEFTVPLSLLWIFEEEPGTVAYLRKVLRPGMTAVDVGANVGSLSLVMGSAVGPTGRVIAVEPGPESLRWLRRNIERNHVANVTVVNAAAGACPGRRSFHVEDTLVLGSFYDHPRTKPRCSLEVEQKTLDELVPDGADLVKIDVEGAELEVLQGASRLLASSPRLVVEWCPATLIAAGQSPTAILSTLTELGYHFTMIDDQRPDVTSTATLGELADRADNGTLPPYFYVNLACERR